MKAECEGGGADQRVVAGRSTDTDIDESFLAHDSVPSILRHVELNEMSVFIYTMIIFSKLLQMSVV